MGAAEFNEDYIILVETVIIAFSCQSELFIYSRDVFIIALARYNCYQTDLY